MDTVQFNLFEPSTVYLEKWVISLKGGFWSEKKQSFCKEVWDTNITIFPTEREANKCLQTNKIFKQKKTSTVYGSRKIKDVATVRQLKDWEVEALNNQLARGKK